MIVLLQVHHALRLAKAANRRLALCPEYLPVWLLLVNVAKLLNFVGQADLYFVSRALGLMLVFWTAVQLLYLVEPLFGSCRQACLELEHPVTKLMVAFQVANREPLVWPCPTNLYALLPQVDTVKVLHFVEQTDLCFVGETYMVKQTMSSNQGYEAL
jgi:hypothetical protein